MTVQPETIGDVADPAVLRRCYGAFATGVTVVSVGGPTPHAMTANSFTTVSLDPPLVLVCVGRDALMHESLQVAGGFAVSVLASRQEPLARYYADRRRPLGEEQFRYTGWTAGTAGTAPLLDGAAAHLECGLWRSYDGGDHTIFLGRVLTLRRSDDEAALLFHDGKFRQIALDRLEVAP